MPVLLLIIGLLFLSNSSYSSEIPKGFAPIDAIFHGSPNQNIKLITPRNKTIRDGEEESLIFATPSLGLASCYLFRWDDSLGKSNYYYHG